VVLDVYADAWFNALMLTTNTQSDAELTWHAFTAAKAANDRHATPWTIRRYFATMREASVHQADAVAAYIGHV
jgi:hypothetical protein